MSGDTSKQASKSRKWLRWLLILPFIAVLWVPFYNSIEPSLGGIPFFYWYQLLWVLISSVLIFFIYLAEGRENAAKAFDLFVKTCGAKYPKATECLSKDREVLLTFYDFPAEQRVHIRTTNPIESTFSTARLRHNKTKGSGSRAACLSMAYKLMESASKSWRSLNGSELLREVIAGVAFEDGVKKSHAA